MQQTWTSPVLNHFNYIIFNLHFCCLPLFLFTPNPIPPLYPKSFLSSSLSLFLPPRRQTSHPPLLSFSSLLPSSSRWDKDHSISLHPRRGQWRPVALCPAPLLQQGKQLNHSTNRYASSSSSLLKISLSALQNMKCIFFHKVPMSINIIISQWWELKCSGVVSWE